jgi:hypothetical protein
MVTVIVSTSCYLHVVSYTPVLAALSVVSLYWWRLIFSVLPCIGGDILLLGASRISCVVGSVARSISGNIGWRVGCGIGSSIGSKVDWLHYFIFASSLCSYGIKGSIAATSLARLL